METNVLILVAFSFSDSYVEMTRLTTYKDCKGKLDIN